MNNQGEWYTFETADTIRRVKLKAPKSIRESNFVLYMNNKRNQAIVCSFHHYWDQSELLFGKDFCTRMENQKRRSR